MIRGSNLALQMLVLENGDYWMMYGNPSTAPLATGFIQGTGTSNNGSFTSPDAKDFGFTPVVAGTVAATYDATAKTVSAGTFTAGANSATFTGGPVPGSLYNYTSAASLNTIAGTYAAFSLANEGVVINVSTNGVFAATTTSGCQYAGLITPRSSGKNVFNVTMRYGATSCAFPGESATGIAIAYPLSNGKTQLVLAATDSTRAHGSGVVGVR
jgi:hypothetical protein